MTTMNRQSIKRYMERVGTEPGLKRNVVVLASLVVLATVAGGVILSNQRFTAPWSDRFELTAEFEAVPGIAPGNGQEVRVAGVIVGQITGARVNDAGRAELIMKLEPGQKIYDNARLVLRPKSPLNEMYVTIDPGGPPAEPLQSGAHLTVAHTERPIQVDEVLASLDDNTRSALTSLLRESDVALASAPENLPAGMRSLADLSEDLRPVAEQLSQRREALRRLVGAVSRISSSVGDDEQRLVSLASALDTTLSSLAAGNKEIDTALGQLPGLTSQLRSSTLAITRLSRQLDPTLRDVASAADTLPSALEKVNETSRALAETVKAAKPAIALAVPVLADLRPFSGNLRTALPRLLSSTARLDPVTAQLIPYLPDLGAFMVNTRSLTSMRDANGGILRGMLEITTTTLPTGALGGLSPDGVTGPLG